MPYIIFKFFVLAGTYCCRVDRGSMKWQVCLPLLHMTSSENRTPDFLILNPIPYALAFRCKISLWAKFEPHFSNFQRSYCNKTASICGTTRTICRPPCNSCKWSNFLQFAARHRSCNCSRTFSRKHARHAHNCRNCSNCRNCKNLAIFAHFTSINEQSHSP